MQSRQHQMPGLTGLHRNLSRLQIAYFTDHDHIRILPQNRTQRARKTHVYARIHLCLPDAVEVVFDRTFHRLYIGHRRVYA